MLKLLSSCQLCPHRCKANRLNGEKGFCGTGKDMETYSFHLHLGEEPLISGTSPVRETTNKSILHCNDKGISEYGLSNGARGSGTIFFSHCNSWCVYCQNYKFSQLGEGKTISISELAEIMLKLQEEGAHNINLVTPTHFVPQIINAICIARDKGLQIPIVYNTNGYELPETLELLDGIVDIFLPDMRYSSNEMAMKYSSLPEYVSYNRRAVKNMYQQVGNLIMEDGIAKRGLIIRHLVLPNRIAGTRETMQFIRDEISPDVHISLMSQYYPVFKASQYPEINREIKDSEYEEAMNIMCELGLTNGWCQERHTEIDRKDFLGENFLPSDE